MKNIDNIVKSAMTTFLAIAATTAFANPSDTQVPDSEKCYGVVKAGLNDCATAKASCSGSAVKNKQADAFLFLPKGVCKKLVGGSLTPGKDN